ncbi:alpha/beta fold hydrolase [Thalassolituus pacificus]|uniref:Alpha/beta hydrolase n=1 Tax=Thalassolituus pacificus TaxID=2975440 RepID=A0A9X3ASU0_9GAMM|nr:alpha/beta hydrolase [Thalassolituus pacificus]MCT7360800.1 alpha/beta hydrolase [Thalassolituus pacificus]
MLRLSTRAQPSTRWLASIATLATLLLGGCSAGQQEVIYDKAIDFARSAVDLTLKTADTGDVNMSYLERQGTGPTVLLLHGFSANKETWLKFAAELPQDYHLIIPDLAGHGETPAPLNQDYNLIRQAERLHQLMTIAGVNQFHIAGNSMGGAISAIYATRYPQQILSLTLMDAAGVDAPEQSEYMQALAQGKNPLIATDEESFEYRWNFVMSEPPLLPWPLRPVVVRKTIAREGINREIFSDMLATREELEASQFEQQLSEKVTMPTLIIWGEEDRVLDVSAAQVFKEKLPQAQVKIYPGIGHLPMVEIPAETAELYSRFIATAE